MDTVLNTLTQLEKLTILHANKIASVRMLRTGVTARQLQLQGLQEQLAKAEAKLLEIASLFADTGTITFSEAEELEIKNTLEPKQPTLPNKPVPVKSPTKEQMAATVARLHPTETK